MDFEIMDLSKLHKTKWLWHAKHPEKHLSEWPEFEKNGGQIGNILSDNFLCYAASRRFPKFKKDLNFENKCIYCPVFPQTSCLDPQTPYLNPPCLEPTELYWKWIVASDRKELRLVAKAIANAEWRGNRMYGIKLIRMTLRPNRHTLPCLESKSIDSGQI